MSSQADFRVLQSTWGLVPLKPCQKVGQWGTNQTCQHRDLHALPVLPLRCCQGEPGSCTAPSTGDVQPPCSSGFQGLKMTQFLDWMQVSNSLSASPSSLRWIDFVPEPMGFFNSKSLRNREWMCYWTVLCLRRALNITAGPLGDGITHSSHLCGVEILHRLTVKPWILLRFTMALRLEHVDKKSRFGTKLKITCARCNTPLTCRDTGLEQRSVWAPTGTTAALQWAISPPTANFAHRDRWEESSRPVPEQAEMGQVMASQANLKIKAHCKSRLVALAHDRD